MKTVNKVLIIVITVLLAVIAGVTLLFYIKSGKPGESAQVVEEEKDSANKKRLSSEDETEDETKADSEIVNSEEEDETEKQQEKSKQERTGNPEIFSVGAGDGAIVRGDYLYLLTTNEIQIYNRASQKLVDQLQGSMSYQMLATDDGLYFADGNDLYYYSLRDRSATLCVSGANNCRMIGIMDAKLYFAYIADMNDDENLILGEYDIVTGDLMRFDTLPGVCAHSTFVMGRDRLFYLEGAGDVSTVALRELDPTTGDTTVIDDSVAYGIRINGDYLYFSQAYPAGDYTRANITLYRYNLLNNSREPIAADSFQKLGTLGGTGCVTDDYIYLIGYNSDDNMLTRISLSDQTRETIAREPSLYFINEWEDGFYYGVSDDYAISESTIYYYDNSTGGSHEICTIEGTAQYVDDSNVYAIDYTDYENQKITVTAY